jgi:protein-S-isoprenylcysteine O-methyltransferase Ste14
LAWARSNGPEVKQEGSVERGIGIGIGIRNFGRATLKAVLDYDNQLIGLVLFALAVDSWVSLAVRWSDLGPYIYHGLYAVPAVNLFVLTMSSIYLTSVSIILLSAKRPIARYETLGPNLLALIGAFSVYCFGFLPASEAPLAPLFVSLSVMSVGIAIVLVSLAYLRRAFTVTPQARHLVKAGPYLIVRHPMYDGNIITLFGLALLVGSLQAFLLFIVTAGFQICRALLEERLLDRAVPDYAVYKRQVGAFFPKFFGRGALKSIGVATFLILPNVQGSAQSIRISDSLQSPFANAASYAVYLHDPGSHFQIQRVQATGTESRCRDWQTRALAGTWFTQADAAAFAQTETTQEQLEGISACRDFFALQRRCQDLYIAKAIGDSTPEAMLNKMDATRGCKSIIGFEKICETLREVKSPLSAPRRAMLSECLDRSIVAARAGLLRPAL